MIKKIFLALLLFLLGSATAVVLFFWKNHSSVQSFIILGEEIDHYQTTNFSLENAPIDSLRGEITEMAGDIFWQSRTATTPAELTDKITVQQGENL